MIGIYLRVSSSSQDTRSQEADLKAWAAAQDDEVQVYRDKASGKSFARDGWQKLWADVQAGQVSKIVIWRLDRLGRTALEMLHLYRELEALKVDLHSLRDGGSLMSDSASARLFRNMLTAFAEYEREVRGERQRAGIEAAREANGGKCPWGGRTTGTRVKVTVEREQAIIDMVAASKSVAQIARTLGLTRRTVYRTLRRVATTR